MRRYQDERGNIVIFLAQLAQQFNFIECLHQCDCIVDEGFFFTHLLNYAKSAWESVQQNMEYTQDKDSLEFFPKRRENFGGLSYIRTIGLADLTSMVSIHSATKAKLDIVVRVKQHPLVDKLRVFHAAAIMFESCLLMYLQFIEDSLYARQDYLLVELMGYNERASRAIVLNIPLVTLFKNVYLGP